MDKNSRKFLKVLALLLCEANNIGGMKSSASGNGNLQLITQNTKNINKANKENTNWIKQNPIKSLLIGLFGVAGLVLGEEIIRHKFFANSNEPTFDEKNVISDNDEILKIIEDLKKRLPEIEKASKNFDKNCKFKTTWEGLSYLLGENATKFVEENYPEWKERLNKNSNYINWQNYYGYESFSLMSMAFTLRLAALEKYEHGDNKNNELLLGENLPKVALKSCNNDDIREERLKKVIVEDNDILRSAHSFLLNHPDLNVKIGLLNAGDPYDPNGFLPNRGRALEEYLSMNTSLVRDLSGKEFRKGQGKQGFYTTRKDFPPVCNWDEKPTIDTVRERLTDPGRDFYHQRGIMSRNVYLIRNLGDCSKNYENDSSFPFNGPNNYSAEFNPPKAGLGAIKFCILSIAGLEDRSKQILDKFGELSISKDNKNDLTVYQTWEKITKTQCEFVLKAFIKEGVKVPFLCAFGAGCFGGKAEIVAKCFKKLLIDEGYIDYFNYVVFPIGYDGSNFKAFENEFHKK